MHAPRSLATLFALVSIGCAAAGQPYAEQAGDALDSITVEAALVVASMDGMTPTTTPEEAANANAGNAGNFWSEGCYTFTVDGATVTYELSGCTGPFGIAPVSGTVVVTYRMTRSSIGFDITTEGLRVGEATINYTLMADVATDARNVSVTSEGSAAGRRGHAIRYSGSYDLRWNGSSQCAGLDGMWTTTVGERSFNTSVANWQRCGASCPQSGGSITFTGDDVFITISFDGSDKAAWSSTTSGSGEIELFCTPG